MKQAKKRVILDSRFYEIKDQFFENGFNQRSNEVREIMIDFYSQWDVVSSFHFESGDFSIKRLYFLKHKKKSSYGICSAIFADKQWNQPHEFQLEDSINLNIRVAMKDLNIISSRRYMTPDDTWSYFIPFEHQYDYHKTLSIKIKGDFIAIGIYPGRSDYKLRDKDYHQCLNRLDCSRLKHFKGWDNENTISKDN